MVGWRLQFHALLFFKSRADGVADGYREFGKPVALLILGANGACRRPLVRLLLRHRLGTAGNPFDEYATSYRSISNHVEGWPVLRLRKRDLGSTSRAAGDKVGPAMPFADGGVVGVNLLRNDVGVSAQTFGRAQARIRRPRRAQSIADDLEGGSARWAPFQNWIVELEGIRDLFLSAF